jgi:hypothetical protein
MYVMPILTVADIQGGYTNLEIAQPADGSRVEVVVFKIPRAVLSNYSIYKGTSISSSGQHIQLTITTIEEVEGLQQLPARAVNLVSTLSTTHNSTYHIYWRPYIQITTTEPAALQKDAKGPMSPTMIDKPTEIYPQAKQAEQAVRTLEFGGKRTKRRKKRRKSRRK